MEWHLESVPALVANDARMFRNREVESLRDARRAAARRVDAELLRLGQCTAYPHLAEALRDFADADGSATPVQRPPEEIT